MAISQKRVLRMVLRACILILQQHLVKVAYCFTKFAVLSMRFVGVGPRRNLTKDAETAWVFRCLWGPTWGPGHGMSFNESSGGSEASATRPDEQDPVTLNGMLEVRTQFITILNHGTARGDHAPWDVVDLAPAIKDRPFFLHRRSWLWRGH